MDNGSVSGASRRADGKPRTALMVSAPRRLCVAAAVLAAGILGAADDPAAMVPPPTPAPVEATPTTAAPLAQLPAPTPATITFSGEVYEVVGDYYLDREGNYWEPLVVTTTAYAPTESECDDTPGITATGTDAHRKYGIAADPRAVPYGTILRVPGYGDAPVDDTGGAMRQDWVRHGIVHLDLRIPLRRYDGQWRSEDEATRIAMEHGVRRDRIVLMKIPMPVTAAR